MRKTITVSKPVQVIFGDNALDPNTWESVETTDVLACIKEHYGEKFPATARIYHNEVAQTNDVTPRTEKEIERLAGLKGRLWVIVYPGNPLVLAIIAIVAVVALAAAMFLLKPKAPTAPNQHVQSPNNSLSDRQNSVRLFQRIPDIFGKVRSTPDLIMRSYTYYDNSSEISIEYEIAYMCIGRGSYDVSDVREDTTLLTQIFGSVAEIYNPYTSPNSGDAPKYRFPESAEPIGVKVSNVSRCSGVNGQTLYAPNYKCLDGSEPPIMQFWLNDQWAQPNGSIRSTDATQINLTKYFQAGDSVVITKAFFDPFGTHFNLNGTYTVTGVTNTIVSFDNAPAVNAGWNDLTEYGGDNHSPSMVIYADAASLIQRTVGPYTVGSPETGTLVLNVIAPSGLYEISSDSPNDQTALEIWYTIDVTPCDINGNPTGNTLTYWENIVGSTTTQGLLGITVELPFTATGYINVQVTRQSETDYSFKGTVVDEIQWKDLYILSNNYQHDFGNVTTVLTKSQANAESTSISSRKLNMWATRLVLHWLGGQNFGNPVPSSNAEEIIFAIALDPFIGNRDVSELDCPNIADAFETVRSYFGIDTCGQFGYTFDDSTLSFEETALTVATACFSVLYRQGSLIRARFEQPTDSSTLLFNHRNCLPKSQTRNYHFGPLNNYDGVALDYVDPNDTNLTGFDQPATMYFPQNVAFRNPNKIKTAGVRDPVQAYMLAARAYNKIIYSNTTVEFTGLQMADTLVLTDRILVSDNTRPDTQDGNIVSVSALILELSQPYEMTGGVDYSICLQHYDKTVEIIDIIAGADDTHIVLAQAPRLPLVTGYEHYVTTAYEIVGSTQVGGAVPFLVSAKNPKQNFTTEVTAAIYDDRYYQNDLDYINGVIDDAGEYGDQISGDVLGFIEVGVPLLSGTYSLDDMLDYLLFSLPV